MTRRKPSRNRARNAPEAPRELFDGTPDDDEPGAPGEVGASGATEELPDGEAGGPEESEGAGEDLVEDQGSGEDGELEGLEESEERNGRAARRPLLRSRSLAGEDGRSWGDGDAGETDGRAGNALIRLYRGQTSFSFVGRKKIWFLISGLVIVAGLISVGVRGLNFGIEFRGGTSWTVLAPGVTTAQATSAVRAAGLNQPVVDILGGKTLEVQGDLNGLSSADQATVTSHVTAALAKLGHTTSEGVSIQSVGPTWGGQVTQRALIALIVFFIAVVIYISFRFEPKMALAAFLAMVHDLLVTVGIYALAGFQVTPDTVIAVLTILGYSLYDTVVVFDRVRENTKGFGASGRMTYSEMIDLSMNQTLARSVNTSLVAIMPVLAVLVIGAEILGATTLQDYGLALMVGLLSGAYSSIFIASPLLAVLKEREPRYATIRARLDARGDRLGLLTPSAAALLGATAGGAGGAGSGRGSGGRALAKNGAGRAPSGVLRPGGAGPSKGAGRPRPSTAALSGARAGGEGGTEPAGTGLAAGKSGSGGGRSGAGAPGGRPAASSTRRPPPRPRKGAKKKRR